MKKLLIVLFCLSAYAVAQTKSSAKAAPKKPTYFSSSEAKWTEMGGLSGAHFMVASGNPATGPSVQYIKADPGVSIPWHWHTPVESIYGDSGTLEVQMFKSNDVVKITSGSFAKMPSHMIHKATCTSKDACLFYVESSGVFDIHFVDENGKPVKSEGKSAAKKTAAGK